MIFGRLKIMGCIWIVVILFVSSSLMTWKGCFAQTNGLATWRGGWQISPTTAAAWSVQTRLPRNYESTEYEMEGRKLKKKKKYKKFLLPLLVAYKLKFFTLIPVLMGGLVLLTGATGLAGFFFALFAATMGLKSGGGHHHR